MKQLKELWNKIKTWYFWIRVPKNKRVYRVINSNELNHIGLYMRGLPEAGKKSYVKRKTDMDQSLVYEVDVLHVERQGKDEYYVDGKYNDLEIKRIS